MVTKVRGDKIKEGSIPLSALASGNYMLNNYNVNEGYLVTELTSNNTYFNVSKDINVVYIIATNHNIIELVKGTKTTLGRGPGATITYDNNGIKIDRSYDFYNVKVYREIEYISPDWNAQEGEPGYIENKPFEFIDKHENAFYYDTYVNPNYIIWDSSSAYDSPAIQIIDYDGFPQYIFLDDKTDGSLYNMDNIFGTGSLNYKWLTDINELGIEIPSYILNEGEDVTTYLNELIKCSTGGIIRKISNVYLPNTVIKTTPQELSDDDKNQALANLGINPVVWKYMCNPYIIFMDKPIPDELRSIIIKENGYVHPIIKNICVVGNYNIDEILQIETITYISGSQIYTEHNFLYYEGSANAFKLDE